MSMRTAPCPRCQNTIVFGERQCGKCQMAFDYGPTAPPQPTQAEIMAALLAVSPAPGPQPAAEHAQPTTSPTPDASAAESGGLEGLDSGRALRIGDVEVEDIPGFIDSTLFACMTPDHVDVVVPVGLEVTRYATAVVQVRQAPEVDSGRAAVGEVGPLDAIPGLYGSDMFKAHIDVAAGAAQASAFLEVSPQRAPLTSTRKVKVDQSALRPVLCTQCGTKHGRSRCANCGTTHPDARGMGGARS